MQRLTVIQVLKFASFYQQQITKNMQKVFIAVLGFSLTFLSVGKPVRVFCQQVPTAQCASKYTYRATGTGFDLSDCVDPNLTCDVNIDNTMQIAACSVDYKNEPCSTGTCIYAPAKSVCTADFGTCPTSVDVYNFQCANCGISTTCAKCIMGYKNGQIYQTQLCLGPTCNSIINVNSSVIACSKDSLGFNCSCCATTDANVPICTKLIKLLSYNSVKNWVTGNNATNNTTNNTTTNNTTNNNNLFEYKPQLVFVCLMVILALIL